MEPGGPERIEPMKAVLTDEPFSDPHWIFERKLDGVRCVARRQGGAVRLVSRTGREINRSFPELVEALEHERCDDFIVDGEIVAFSGEVTSFERLQRRMQLSDPGTARRSRIPVFLYVFDLLWHAGEDVRPLPLRRRKARLRQALSFHRPVRFTPHRNESGEELFREACRKGLEGVIAKRADSPYRSGRSRDWLKLKCHAEQELVIGGFTAPKGSRTEFGALLVGHYEDGDLRYGARSGPASAAAPSRTLAVGCASWSRRSRRSSTPVRSRPARAGCAPSSSPKSHLPSGRATGACATHAISDCVTTSPPAKWCASGPDEGRDRSSRQARRAAPMTVEITHPDKVLFPGDGITKADLASYYERVSDWMLPHVRARPVSMQRFPDGIEKPGFFHKDIPDYFPDWVRRVEVPKEDGAVTHAITCDADTLVYLVGQNTITPHVWLSRADRVWQPDRLVFDLDPAGRDFTAVRRAARWTGELLRELGLAPFTQVTGSNGIHVWAPLRRRPGFDEVRSFARDAAAVLAERHPDELTVEMRKAKRQGRILVDVMRNGYAQTAVPPYAVRPRPGAPVATPLEWDELSDSKLRPDRWTVRSVLRRLSAKGDPWKDIQSHARGLSRPRRKLEALR